MKTFGLREANQHFGRLIRTVRRGEDVVLLDRGKPIAMVRPVRDTETAIDKLIARGVVTTPTRPGLLAPFRPVRTKRGIAQAVIDERGERD